jgi:AcrR family transcriptional regulator
MIMKNSQDRRIRKTESQLRDALITLMKEKSLTEITVREISNVADINRGTFYLHYKDVNDLVEQTGNEIFNEFTTVLNARTLDELKDNTALIFQDVFSYMSENAELYSVLLSRKGDIAFLQRLKDLIKEKCYKNWDAWYNEEKNCYFETFATFIVGGCVGVVQDWLAGGMTEPPEEIALMVHDIIMMGPGILK